MIFLQATIYDKSTRRYKVLDISLLWLLWWWPFCRWCTLAPNLDNNACLHSKGSFSSLFLWPVIWLMLVIFGTTEARQLYIHMISSPNTNYFILSFCLSQPITLHSYRWTWIFKSKLGTHMQYLFCLTEVSNESRFTILFSELLG